MRKLILFSILFSALLLQGFSQPAGTIYHFKFYLSDKNKLDYLTTIISIDNYKNDTVWAYANNNELRKFKKTEIKYQLIVSKKAAKSIAMASSINEMSNWDKYPTYNVYIDMMQKYAADYPKICTLKEIGTLQSGRKLLVVKISNKPESEYEKKPEIFFTSTMHGNETGGYIVLLHFIDYLLKNYNNTNTPEVKNLIDNCEIWINPLANPDGTYKAGNNDISGAIRYNGNYIDLNRNFPDLAYGEHPDGNSYQEETQMMMNFAQNRNFSLSVNIHSGNEVVNYPWDTWSKETADNNWWIYVGGMYRDLAQANSPDGYFTSVNNGLTKGYDWYSIHGGRQDYMNWFNWCREFTLEISTTKIYPAENLPQLWNYNKEALFNYALQSLYGIHGTVTNLHGLPVKAKIEILNHDFDNSEVYSDSLTGFFVRYLKSGTYNLKISAPGYADKFINNVNIIDNKKTELNIIIGMKISKLCIDTAIIKKNFYTDSNKFFIPIANCGNIETTVKIEFADKNDTLLLSVDKDSLTINPFKTAHLTVSFFKKLTIDTSFYSKLLIQTPDSIYQLNLAINYFHTLFYVNTDMLNYLLFNNIEKQDSFLLKNLSDIPADVEISLSKPVTWLNLQSENIQLNPFENKYFKININTHKLTSALLSTDIIFKYKGIEYIKPVNLIVETASKFQVAPYHNKIKVTKPDILKDSLIIKNAGGSNLNYNIKASSNISSIIYFDNPMGILSRNESKTVTFSINSNLTNTGIYTASFNLTNNIDTLTLPLSINIDTFPQIYIPVDTFEISVEKNGLYRDSLLITNIGGNILTVKSVVVPTYGCLYLYLNKKFILIPAKQSRYLYFSAKSCSNSGKFYGELNINDKIIIISYEIK
jgi:hypothetical protein